MNIIKKFFAGKATSSAQRKTDVGSLELIEVLLYLYALSRFLSDFGIRVFSLLRSEKYSSAHTGIILSGILFVFCFSIIIFRSYINIRILDGRRDDTLGYPFVLNNAGILRSLEKGLRLVSVLVIIVTPKLSEGILFGVGNTIINYFESILISISYIFFTISVSALFYSGFKYENLEAMHLNGDKIFHGRLEYYSAVVFVLFIIYTLWDVVNAVGVKRRMPSGEWDYATRKGHDAEENGDVLSYVAYLNLRHREADMEESGGHVDKYSRALGRTVRQRAAKLKERLRLGNIYYLYFRYSPKFRERMSLLIFSISAMSASLTEGGIAAIIFMILSFASYLYYSVKDVKFGPAVQDLTGVLKGYF